MSKLQTENANKEGKDDNESTDGSASTSNASCKKSLRSRQRMQTRATNTTYIYDSHAKEDHAQALFGVAFNHHMGQLNARLFATTGGCRCTIYECPPKGGIKLLSCFADPDKEEIFYTCAWSYDKATRSPLVAAGGLRGIIRVFHLDKHQTVCNFIGHGQAINDLKFHPRQLDLLLSASKDHSARLWNVQSKTCIAVFGGVDGHRDEVISIDFHHLGGMIISSGMDHALKIWRIDTPEFKKLIGLSRNHVAKKGNFATFMQHLPDYSTRDVHSNYVDCVHWCGDFVFSKSCENAIVCWKPGKLGQSFKDLKPNDGTCTIIQEFEFENCDIWFIRFAFHINHKIMALGKPNGKINVWELDPTDPEKTRTFTLNHMQCNSTIRQIAFSLDASQLLAVCDDGTIWRWNKKSSQ